MPGLAVVPVCLNADKARTQVHLINVQPPLMTGNVSVLVPAELARHPRRSAGALALLVGKALLERHGFSHTAGAEPEPVTA